MQCEARWIGNDCWRSKGARRRKRRASPSCKSDGEVEIKCTARIPRREGVGRASCLIWYLTTKVSDVWARSRARSAARKWACWSTSWWKSRASSPRVRNSITYGRNSTSCRGSRPRIIWQRNGSWEETPRGWRSISSNRDRCRRLNVKYPRGESSR